MKLLVKNHKFHYEMEKLVRIFLPDVKIQVIKDEETDDFQLLTEIGEQIVVTINFEDFSI